MDINNYGQWLACKELLVGFNEGFLLMYAINSYESFSELRGLYQEISTVQGRDGFAVVLVGNKSDLEDQRTVPVEGRSHH